MVFRQPIEYFCEVVEVSFNSAAEYNAMKDRSSFTYT